VSASPTSIFGSGVFSANTTSTTATATGGVAPYTYSWAVTSGQAVGLYGAFTSTVYAQFGGGAGTYTSTLTCTVTDSLSHTATTTVSSTIVLSQ
jgi:hypothetical protein